MRFVYEMDSTRTQAIIRFLKEKSSTCVIGHKEIFPIIACYRIDFYHVAFWCPECNRIHKHGWADGHPDGHRVAHCSHSESIFSEGGYILCCKGDLTKKEVGEYVC